MIHIKKFIFNLFSKPKTKSVTTLFFYYFFIVIFFLSIIQYIFNLIVNNNILRDTALFLVFIVVFSVIFRFNAIINFLSDCKKK